MTEQVGTRGIYKFIYLSIVSNLIATECIDDLYYVGFVAPEVLEGSKYGIQADSKDAHLPI